MVGKSYIVSQLTKTLKKKEASSEDDVEKHCCDRQCCDHNISEMKKNKNSNFFAMNEMVKPATTAKRFFFRRPNKSENTDLPIKWKETYADEFLNFYIKNSRLMLIAAFIFLILVGFLITTYLNSSKPYHRQQFLINRRTNKSDNGIIEKKIKNNTSSTKIIISKNDLQQEDYSNNYDDRESINFFTTSNKNLYSVKVIPTLPTIVKPEEKMTENNQYTQSVQNCQSTSLPFCQGALTYDLTDSHQRWNLTNIEYYHFQHLLNSNCSSRVKEYVCHLLEPECQTLNHKKLQPCRRLCKGILESCNHIIASSEVLTEFFDCNNYIDSNDETQCEDITRAHKMCFENEEFQCKDFSCIPLRWRCDNIRDCATGEDEADCKFCNYDEFKCISDQICIPDKWHCDGNEDCSDGSDENCDLSESKEFEYIHEPIDYNSEEEINKSTYDYDDINSDDKFVSTGDGVVPVFVINPNSTNLEPSRENVDLGKQASTRFRSTMRKLTTPPTAVSHLAPEKPSEGPKIYEDQIYSTAHTSPCPQDYLRCIDGLCITLDQICDKIKNCADNSDELHCEY